MTKEEGIDVLFNGTEPSCYAEEPEYLDVDNIRTLDIYRKVPDLEAFINICLTEYPDLNYQLFNYNIKHLKLIFNNNLFSKLQKAITGDYYVVNYNAVKRTLHLNTNTNQGAIRTVFVNLLGTKCYTHQMLTFYKQGLVYEITMSALGVEEVISNSNKHFDGSSELNEAFDFYVANRYFYVPDCLTPDLRGVMCKIEMLLGEDLLQRYAVADSVGLLNDLSLYFEESQWIEFKFYLSYLFDYMKIKTVNDEAEYQHLQASLSKLYDGVNQLLDQAQENKKAMTKPRLRVLT